MNRARNLAAFLLFVTGGLHLVSAAIGSMPVASAVVTIIFGVAYLALGYFMLRADPYAVYITTGVTLLGLILSFVGLAQAFQPILLLFFLLDVIILALCVYVILRIRRRLPAS